MSTTPTPFFSASTYHPFAEQEQRPRKQRGESVCEAQATPGMPAIPTFIGTNKQAQGMVKQMTGPPVIPNEAGFIYQNALLCSIQSFFMFLA